MQFLVQMHLKNFQRLQIALVICYGLVKYLVFDKFTRFLTPISLEIMSVLIPIGCSVSFEAKSSFSIFVLNVMQDVCISVRGGGGGG